MLVKRIHVDASKYFLFIIEDMISHFLRKPGRGGSPERERSRTAISVLCIL